ncbi:MAG: alpha/beta hydrolase [Porticoccaceae bacterium]|jgi:acetyl esterase/lipase
MALDPELQVFAGFRLPDFADIHGVRQWERALAANAPAVDPALAAGVAHEDFEIPGPAGAPAVPVRLYRPDASARCPVLIYFHGGSFLMGGLDTDHRACLRYASGAGCAVLSVDYRLAPEHPFPAAVEDAYAALCGVADGGGELGLDTGRIALGGSSAGATLAAGTALMARDRRGPVVCHQLLVHPALDDRLSSDSMNAAGQDYGVNRQVVSEMWRHYLAADPAAAVSPYAAPARCQDLAGLPAAYVETGELDPLRDEAMEYAARLLHGGVSVDFHLFAGAPHSFDMVADAAVSRQAFASRVLALRRAFAR